MSILFKAESYALVGACFEVYNEKGCGFLEPVYQECLEIELGLMEIPFCAQPGLELSYKGRRLKQRYVPDFICFRQIIVELEHQHGIGPCGGEQFLALGQRGQAEGRHMRGEITHRVP